MRYFEIAWPSAWRILAGAARKTPPANHAVLEHFQAWWNQKGLPKRG